MSPYRLFDRGRLIVGWFPWSNRDEWRLGFTNGEIARWLDLGPLYLGWRTCPPAP